MEKIVAALSKNKEKTCKDALDVFFDVRKIPGLKKKPSTSE